MTKIYKALKLGAFILITLPTQAISDQSDNSYNYKFLEDFQDQTNYPKVSLSINQCLMEIDVTYFETCVEPKKVKRANVVINMESIGRMEVHEQGNLTIISFEGKNGIFNISDLSITEEYHNCDGSSFDGKGGFSWFYSTVDPPSLSSTQMLNDYITEQCQD